MNEMGETSAENASAMHERVDSIPAMYRAASSRSSQVLGVVRILSAAEQQLARIILAFALLSGAVLMTPMLTAGALALDEYGTYWIAGNGPMTLGQRSLDYENIPPLSPWLHRVFMNVLGETEFSFRLPSAVWFLMAIAMTYLLGREFRGPLFGALCALVLAWNPTLLTEISFARCYSLTVLLAASCFWASVRWIKRPYDYTRAAVWAVTSVALVWTHYLNAAIVGATLLALICRINWSSDRGLVFLCLAALLIGFCVSPLYVPFIRMANWGEYFGFQNEAPFFETVSPIWWAGFPVGILAAWISDRVFARSGQNLGGSVPRRISRIGWLLLAFWGIAPVAAALILGRGEWASLANPRYRIGFEVAACCLAVAVLSVRVSNSAVVTGVLITILAAWIGSGQRPWVPRRLTERQSEDWKQMALHVHEHGTDNETVFVQGGLGEGYILPILLHDEVFQDYAACRMGRFYLKRPVRRLGLPFLWKATAEVPSFYASILDEIRNAEVSTCWIAAATDTDLNQYSAMYFEDLAKEHGFHEASRMEYPSSVLIRLSADKE
jgi:hypothetical protein